jgi:hypothetical protein
MAGDEHPKMRPGRLSRNQQKDHANEDHFVFFHDLASRLFNMGSN